MKEEVTSGPHQWGRRERIHTEALSRTERNTKDYRKHEAVGPFLKNPFICSIGISMMLRATMLGIVMAMALARGDGTRVVSGELTY